MLLILSNFLFTNTIFISGYSQTKGIEWGDRVNVGCRRYIDGKLKSTYTETNPLEVTIDERVNNYNFVKKLVGMKVGETKDSISWYVTQSNGTVNFIEYKDVTIIRIVYDSTPDYNGPGAGTVLLIILKALLGIAIGVAGVYGAYKLYKRFNTKKCSSCGVRIATKKCSKCGALYCDECSIKGCKVCKSQTFIKL